MGLFRGLGTAIIVVVLAYAIYRNAGQFQEASLSLDYTLVGLSTGLWLLGYLLFALGWDLVLRRLGSSIGWWRASRVWFLSQGLKYIPGSVAYAVGRVHLAREEGVQGIPAALGLALENLLPLATAVLLFLALLPFGLVQTLPSNLTVGVLVAAVALTLSLPLFLGRLPAVWPMSGNISLGYKALAALLAFYVLVWLVVGLACYLSFRSLGQGFPLSLWQVLGLYAISWAGGLVAVFAPGGLGVRDGILIVLMSSFIPFPLAAAGAAVVRVQTLAVEGLLAFLAMKFWPITKT